MTRSYWGLLSSSKPFTTSTVLSCLMELHHMLEMDHTAEMDHTRNFLYTVKILWFRPQTGYNGASSHPQKVGREVAFRPLVINLLQPNCQRSCHREELQITRGAIQRWCSSLKLLYYVWGSGRVGDALLDSAPRLVPIHNPLQPYSCRLETRS